VHDPGDIFDLAKCLSQGEHIGEALQNMVRGRPLAVPKSASDAAAGCVMAAELPLTMNVHGLCIRRANPREAVRREAAALP